MKEQTSYKRKYSLYFRNEQLQSDMEAMAAYYKVSFSALIQEALTEYMSGRKEDLDIARRQEQERLDGIHARNAQPEDQRQHLPF